MNHCLVCGAKSWGPVSPGVAVSGIIDTNTFQVQLTEADVKNWRKCDACGAIANAALIEQDPISGPEPDAEFSSPFDAMMRAINEGSKSAPNPDYNAIIDRFTSLIPTPETREERLVKAVMRTMPPATNASLYATDVVLIAREIGHAMDKPNPLDGERA